MKVGVQYMITENIDHHNCSSSCVVEESKMCVSWCSVEQF